MDLNPLEPWLDKIHNMDCLAGLKQLPDASVDTVITSPPYNLRNSTGGGMRNGAGGLWDNAALLNGYATHADDMPYPDYVAWQRSVLTESMRIVKPDTGAVFYNHKWRVQAGVLQDRREIVDDLPMPIRQIIIWQRAGGINFNLGYLLPTYEVIYFFCNKKFRLASPNPDRPKEMCRYGDVWFIPQQKSKHPAPFPVELPRRCIEITGAKTVVDPFMGSGSTAIAALTQGAGFIGFDNSAEYVIEANERIEKWKEDEHVNTVTHNIPPNS